LGGALGADVAEAELHGVVAVALGRADVRHNARTDFDDGHSRDRAVLSEKLSHAALASYDQRHDRSNSFVCRFDQGTSPQRRHSNAWPLGCIRRRGSRNCDRFASDAWCTAVAVSPARAGFAGTLSGFTFLRG